MEFFNIELEEKFLKCILWDKSFYIKMLRKGVVPKEILADKTLRLLFSLVQQNFNKQGSIPDSDIIKSSINKLSERTKNAAAFKEKMYAALDRITFSDPEKETKDNFDVYTRELIVLFEARALQGHVSNLFDQLDSGLLTEAKNSVNSFRINSIGEDIDQGEFTESFKERELDIIERVKNPEKYELFPIGIPQADEVMMGGLSNEFMLISGSSNSGKSFALEHVAAYNYRCKKNVIYFTIEMQKLEAMNRIDMYIAGLESGFFRNPAKNWTKDLHQKWRDKMKFAHKNYGKLMTVAFNKGATMGAIEGKMYDIMNLWQEPIHGVCIDYLDDITPMKEYKESKSWSSFGEIAWDMHLLAKGFRNFNGALGIPVVSAMQLKKQSKEISLDGKKANRFLDERDIGSSPLPYRMADVVWGLKTVVDGQYSILEGMKGRFFGKNKRVDIFHNFPYGKFHDESLREKFNEELKSDEKEEIEQIEEMVIEKPDKD